MATDKSVSLSQGFEVLAPKGGRAFPILCSEWDSIRDQVQALEVEPWGFQNIGSILLGVAGGAFIGLVSGSISHAGNYIVITWAVLVTSALAGGFALYFAKKEKGIHRTKAENITQQMRMIEERFDRTAPDTLSTVQTAEAPVNPFARKLSLDLLNQFGALKPGVKIPPPPPPKL